MESNVKVLENQLGLLEHQLELWNRPQKCWRTGLDYWNIYWSNAILYKSAGEPVRTAGTSAGVMESYIKELENPLGLLEHHLESWNLM